MFKTYSFILLLCLGVGLVDFNPTTSLSIDQDGIYGGKPDCDASDLEHEDCPAQPNKYCADRYRATSDFAPNNKEYKQTEDEDVDACQGNGCDGSATYYEVIGDVGPNGCNKIIPGVAVGGMF